MGNSLIEAAFAMEAINDAAYEIEKCWYAEIADVSELEKADSKVVIEQWETRSPTGVIRVRAYDDSEYELCVKRYIKDEDGDKRTIEKEMDIDKEFFMLVKGLCPSGTFKTRYEFSVPDSQLKWEIDIYKDNDDKDIKWIKIDLEIPTKDTPIPEFPITLGKHFDQDEANDDEKEFKDLLFEKKYNRYNEDHIQKGFEDSKNAPKKEEENLDVETPTVEEIAEKHGVTVEDIQAQLEKGKEVEKEHTSDEKTAEEIALDHLNEKADYYDRLEEVEGEEEETEE